MSINGILAIIGIVGLLASIVGRWMVASAASHLGFIGRSIIWTVPLADVMFMARNWDDAKNGVCTSMIGLALMMPWTGKTMWDHKHAPPPKTVNSLVIDGDVKNNVFLHLKLEHEARIERQTYKIQKLNANLAGWFQRMEAKRPTLKTDAEIAAFNQEAADYQALHAEIKSEAAELMKLHSKKYESWSFLTDQEVNDYLERTKPPEKKKSGMDIF